MIERPKTDNWQLDAWQYCPGGTVDDLIARVDRDGSRLYDRDFLGRSWLAYYVADVDTLVQKLADLRKIVQDMSA